MPNKDFGKWMFRRKVPLRGDAGPEGDQGNPGPTGNVGPIGPQGVAGPQGIQGIQGPVGNNGLPNVTGFSTTPGRAFNTNFTPHATRPVVCIYSVQLHTVLTALGTSFAQVQLLSDPSGTPTTVCGLIRHQRVLGLGISVNEQSDVICSVYHLVPPGYVVRLVPTTGNGGTATLLAQTEIIL